jgi:hypothetical protein
MVDAWGGSWGTSWGASWEREAVEEAAVGGFVPVCKWYIYPDGRRLYQTEDQARDTLRDYLSRRRKKPKPAKVKAAVVEALAEDIEPLVLADYGLLQELDLPALPNIELDFAPPLIDNTALETVWLRAQDAQARMARQRMMILARQRDEEALLTLLLA